MGLFDLFSSDLSSGNLFDTVSDVAGLLSESSYGSHSGGPAQFSPPVYSVGYGGGAQAYPAMGAAGPALSQAGALVGRSLRAFPSLANSIAALRARGIRATAESLYAMLKKFGPANLVATGFLTSAAISDLMYYKTTHKRRRMNPANTRALRRSLRRLKSFDNLAHRVSSQLSHSCKKRRK